MFIQSLGCTLAKTMVAIAHNQ